MHCESFDELAYHFDILCSNEFIEGKVSHSAYLGQKATTSIDYYNLTFEGHKLLDGMRSQTIWNKIKFKAQGLGVEGLKQIPALAISLLTSQSS